MIHDLDKNQKQSLIWQCVAGLIQYADELSKGETDLLRKAVLGLVESIKAYWNLDSASIRKVDAKWREEKISVMIGLYHHMNDLLFVQGVDARDEITMAKDIMTAVAEHWNLDEFQVLTFIELIDTRLQLAEKEKELMQLNQQLKNVC